MLAVRKPTPTPHVWRCWRCGRVIGEYRLPVSFLRQRCKCGAWNEIRDGEQRQAA